MMSKVLYPSEIEFSQLYQNNDLLLVIFYASWSAPCQKLAPHIDKLAQEHPEATVMKIDIDAYPTLAAKFKAETIPSMFVVKKGIITRRRLGFVSYSTLEEILKD